MTKAVLERHAFTLGELLGPIPTSSLKIVDTAETDGRSMSSKWSRNWSRVFEENGQGHGLEIAFNRLVGLADTLRDFDNVTVVNQYTLASISTSTSQSLKTQTFRLR